MEAELILIPNHLSLEQARHIFPQEHASLLESAMI
jgi:hypothetical protein